MHRFRKILLVAGFILLAQTEAWTTDLDIRIDNPPPSGTVFVFLFDTPDAFGDLRNPARTEAFPLDGRDAYRIDNLRPGRYALLVYFDENGNGRLDRNFIGIPQEPLAYSNRYRPKGPPSFARAAFLLAEEETLRLDVELYRPLGKRGRLGIGLGVIGQSSPYREADDSVVQLIPALTYTGERLQIYGPFVRFGLTGNDRVRLAATGQYRIKAYEEGDSPFLAGLGDRKDTFLAGLSLVLELPGGVDLSLDYQHDVLDRIGGGTAGLGIDRTWPIGLARVTPGIRLNWLDAKLARHDFGVPAALATVQRPAYEPGSAINVEAGVGVFLEMTRNWLVVANLSAEILDDAITASPIVSEDVVWKGFAALNYVF